MATAPEPTPGSVLQLILALPLPSRSAFKPSRAMLVWTVNRESLTVDPVISVLVGVSLIRENRLGECGTTTEAELTAWPPTPLKSLL